MQSTNANYANRFKNLRYSLFRAIRVHKDLEKTIIKIVYFVVNS
jgi:hypothetical protein